MPSARNVRLLDDTTEKLARAKVAIATDFAGIPTGTLTELRRHLRANGMDYKVVKNTLMERSADAVGKPEVKELLAGPTGIAFGYDDGLQAIKVITEYVRANRSPITVRGAALDGRVFRGDQLTQLTQLPSRQVLLGQLVGQLASPMSRLVNVLNSPLAGLAMVLQQRARQLEGSPQESLG
ncbi:MAG: 50S ribosomal protein L10 [Chloroflexi bacterium]|nr:50S ribosomal protein L10 [Chloroflexota bacterium]